MDVEQVRWSVRRVETNLARLNQLRRYRVDQLERFSNAASGPAARAVIQTWSDEVGQLATMSALVGDQLALMQAMLRRLEWEAEGALHQGGPQ